MPEKPKAPAPRGVAWDPDIYNALDFVNGLNDLRAKPGITMVPPVAMEQLARLARARVVDNEVFRAGITFSVEAARKDFPLLSTPVYRQELIDRIEKVEEAARRLQQELQTVENPVDRISLWAGSAIRHELTGFAYTTPLTKSSETGECEIKEARDKLAHALAPYLRELSVLIEASTNAKTSSFYLVFAQKRGTPSGTGGSGMALTRFVAHLAFAALAALGHWTLNKNDQSGTLIEAIELLRKFLPIKFLPPKGQHPYSTYQKILTDARYQWELGHFPYPRVD
jgi:hypothetical protein